MDRRGSGPELISGHSSGKWKLTDSHAFDVNVRRMRHHPRTIVTRTEATDPSFSAQLRWPGDGWGQWHPKGLGDDCSVEWDQAVWHVEDRGVLQLTEIQIHTEKGHLQPPVALTWALLVHRATEIELEVGVAHLDLSNTALRRQANKEECHMLNEHYRESQRVNPRRRHLLQMDGNRDQRQTIWQRYFQAELMLGTSLRTGWHKPLPKQGTHGNRLLDVAIADFPIHSELLPDDPSSDHRPFVTTGQL